MALKDKNMTIHLNHTIVSARDRDKSAQFLTELLGLPAPIMLGPFAVVTIGDTSLDYMETDDEMQPQHYAFLVSESEFDQIFERIRARGLCFWADPSRDKEGQINTWDGWTWHILGRSQWPPAGDNHAAIRQWRYDYDTSPSSRD
jgi:hypothetical protein